MLMLLLRSSHKVAVDSNFSHISNNAVINSVVAEYTPMYDGKQVLSVLHRMEIFSSVDSLEQQHTAKGKEWRATAESRVRVADMKRV
jgi:hypothetical protein